MNTLSEEQKQKINEEEEYRDFVRYKLQKQNVQDVHHTHKDPAIAALLSLIIPGAGQIYLGQLGKGLLILFTCWLVIPWIYGIFSAYNDAKRT